MTEYRSRSFSIGYVRPEDYEVLGRMTVDVYAGLPDMPGPEIQPDYYAMLADVRARATGPGTEILVAVSDIATLLGGVTFVRDMSAYNSGGNASTYTEHAGIRLLVVSPDARRQGVGKALTQSCIRRAKDLGRKGVVLHTTRAMAVAWQMYENMGFQRCTDLDFKQGELQVYGFCLDFKNREQEIDYDY